MTRWVVIVEANLDDPSKEDEFHSWYEQVLVPDVLEFGCLSVTRLRDRDPAEGRGEFVTLFEIETDDVDQSIRDMQAFRAGRSSFPGLSMVARAFYTKLSDHVYQPYAFTKRHNPGS